MRLNVVLFLVVTAISWGGCLSAAPPRASDPGVVDEAAEAALAWLAAKPEERAAFEPLLERYDREIGAVIRKITPQGSPAFEKIVGRQVKGDTFTVPELLARNPDHPFNYYVPSHYDPAKPMGLILWMHGGGKYKPGANIERRSVGRNLKRLEAGDYILVAAEACHGANFPKGAVLDAMAGRWSVPASERYLSDLVNEFMHRYHIDPNRIVLKGYSMGGIGAYNHAMRTDRFAAVGIGGGSWTWGYFRRHAEHAGLYLARKERLLLEQSGGLPKPDDRCTSCPFCP